MSDLCNEQQLSLEEAMTVQEGAFRIMLKLPEDLREEMIFHIKLQHGFTTRNLDKNAKLQKENAKLQKENAKLQKQVQKFRRKEAADQKTLDFHRERLGLSKDATREEIEKANRIHHERRRCEIAKCKKRKREAKDQWRAERAVATMYGAPFESWKERAKKLEIDNWLSKPAVNLELCDYPRYIVFKMLG